MSFYCSTLDILYDFNINLIFLEKNGTGFDINWKVMAASSSKHYTMNTTRPQRKKTTKKHLEKRYGEENVDSRLQVQLAEDGDDSTGPSWVETRGLWL